jgi:hypothetical protein
LGVTYRTTKQAQIQPTEAIPKGDDETRAPLKRRDLSAIAGSWKGEKDVESVLAEQDVAPADSER